jgi:hypothetical protein
VRVGLDPLVEGKNGVLLVLAKVTTPVEYKERKPIRTRFVPSVSGFRALRDYKIVSRAKIDLTGLIIGSGPIWPYRSCSVIAVRPQREHRRKITCSSAARGNSSFPRFLERAQA